MDFALRHADEWGKVWFGLIFWGSVLFATAQEIWPDGNATVHLLVAGAIGVAGGLAVDRDVARVAAKRRDVVAHPFERSDLVEQSVVAGAPANGFLAQFGMRQETEQPESIVWRDDDHAALCEPFAVRARFRTGTSGEAAAVEYDEHG